MAYKTKILPVAYKDLLKTHEWYNNQKDFLGDEFKQAVNAEIKNISVNPEHYQLHFKEIRQAVVKRFPYVIFFLCNENIQQVVIFGILHTKRNPKIITGRIK